MRQSFNTPRLKLDILSNRDWSFIKELVNTKGWIEFIGDKHIHTQEESIAYINRIVGDPHFTYWVVRLNDSQKPVGVVSFIKRDYLPHHDIGFAFLPHFQANGYAFESVKEVLLHMGRNARHPAVLATTFPHNSRSIKLLQKLGFQFKEAIEVNAMKLHVYSVESSALAALDGVG